MEEMNVTNLLDVISSFIDPRVNREVIEEVKESSEPSATGASSSSSSGVGTSGSSNETLPREIVDLLKNSCLFPAIASYLRNDSVLDMARHVPLYRSIMLCLRSLVSKEQLVPLLAPWESRKSDGDDQPITSLLSKMKDVVDNYSRRLT